MVVVDEKAKEEAMMAKISSGQKLESLDEVTPEYKESLLRLMIAQADSELAGAYGYVPWIQGAPTMAERLAMANIVKDEIRHARAMYDLLDKVGVDTNKLIEDDMKNRMKVFYEPIKSWADLVMFNFLMDRAAGHQLRDAAECSWGPWSRAMVQIEKEEWMHVRHGEHWVKKLAASPETRAEIQTALDFWFPKVNRVFGKGGSKTNKEFQHFKLKQRDNQEVRESWYNETKPLLEGYGLTVPAVDVIEKD
ncbi:MAG: phenylacetate-CoA oxygenase subunit PaaI [Candidatus Obscuribacterales bacterium]|nr:phenylacetate-CoA oxygenase subunit PaaI [Candidatus Obscuribacterales bacterium]